MISFPKDYCFIIGEQFDNTKIDCKILEGEVTIGCNYTINIFQPSIYIAGSCQMLKYLINNHTFNNTTTYILSPTALIVNTYNINTMQLWHENIAVINANSQSHYTSIDTLYKLQDIANQHPNVFFIEDLKKLSITRNLFKVIDQETLHNNMKYCHKYNNIIPTIIIKYAKQYNINYIFLIGCNLKKYGNDKTIQELYNGIKLRTLKMTNKNIYMINGSVEGEEDLDFLPTYDLIKLYQTYIVNNKDIKDVIMDYVNYCKIDLLKKESKEKIIEVLYDQLNNIMLGKDVLDYTNYTQHHQIFKNN